MRHKFEASNMEKELARYILLGLAVLVGVCWKPLNRRFSGWSLLGAYAFILLGVMDTVGRKELGDLAFSLLSAMFLAGGLLAIGRFKSSQHKTPALSRLPLWVLDLAVLGLLVAFGLTGNGWWLVAAIAAMIGIWIAARRAAGKGRKFGLNPQSPSALSDHCVPEEDDYYGPERDIGNPYSIGHHD
jgi:multisubunit Na+/H+ antiporter MnhG subunit